jgi:hypothetical protein
MRTIKVYSTVGASGEVVTNVGTLRELKPILVSKGIDIAGMKLVVGETRNELSIDEAVLPDGDFKLYLMPQKTKSGGIEEDLESISDEIDGVHTRLGRIESKLDRILSGQSTSNSGARVIPTRSAEDEEALRDIARLSGGNGDW